MKFQFEKKILYALLVALPVICAANEDARKAKGQQKAFESTVKTLRSLVEARKKQDQTISDALKELKKSGEEANKEKIKKSLDTMKADMEKLELKLESIATGVAVEEYRAKEPEKFELQKEIENLLQPMIYALKSVTQDSRQIEQFRQNIKGIELKEEVASTAVRNLQKLVPNIEDVALKSRLEKMLLNWQKEQESLTEEKSILLQQLQLKLESKESLISSTGEVFAEFFRSRGVNFLLGLSTFIVVFFVLRFLHATLKKLRSRNANRKKSSFVRLTDLIFTAASFIIAIVATLFTFNLRNDWLLLGLGALFLLALGWILIKSLPTMVEQVMLLLNLGSVREGERLIYSGIPWEVKSLNFYTHFYNPVLTGGSLHISVRELVGMVSRPAATNEEWFPSKEGEWVKLGDGTLGQVVYQSPEMVEIEVFGGSRITYSTGSYLALNPMNLSHGYRIQMVFGIDYKYQAQCTTEIPDKMKAMFTQELVKLLGKDQLVKAYTDFFKPNTSSLDFEYEAYVKGTSAHQYEEVERVMIYSFANACNKYGWEIPFQQITLHQTMN